MIIPTTDKKRVQAAINKLLGEPVKHLGPGPHPSGSDQDVHGGGGGGGGAETVDDDETTEQGLYDRIFAKGGATYQPTIEFSPTTGFSVSTHPELSEIIDVDKFKPTDIAKYVTKNQKMWSDVTNHFGAWHDTDEDKVWLDVISVIADKKEAIDLAVKHNQKAIYDLGKDEEIQTGGTGRSFMKGGKGGGRHTVASVPADKEGCARFSIQAFEAVMGRKATEEEIAEVRSELGCEEKSQSPKKKGIERLTRSNVKATLLDMQQMRIEKAIPKFDKFFRSIINETVTELSKLTDVPRSVDAVFPTDLKEKFLDTASRPLIEAIVYGAMTELELFDRLQFDKHRKSNEKLTTATHVLQILGLQDIGDWFSFEVPQWLADAALMQVSNSFQQQYWGGVIETTRNALRDLFDLAIRNGHSIRRLSSDIMREMGPAYSRMRATRVARTEMTDALNFGHTEGIKRLNRDVPQLEIGKEWLSVFAQTSRDAHMANDGVVVPADGTFTLNGVACHHPGDPLLPAGDRINCMCTILSSFIVDEMNIRQDDVKPLE